MPKTEIAFIFYILGKAHGQFNVAIIFKLTNLLYIKTNYQVTKQ